MEFTEETVGGAGASENAVAPAGGSTVLPQGGGSLADNRAVDEWVRARLDPHASVAEVTAPAEAGYSARTLIVRLAQPESDRPARLVLKVAGGDHLLPDMLLEREHAVIEALQGTDLPLAPLRGFEADSTWLGAPFIAMDFVPGSSPTDVPLYHLKGWLADASPAQRSRVWLDGLRTMAIVHALEPERLRLRSHVPDPGIASVRWHVVRLGRDLEWVCGASEPPPTAARALRWLRDHAFDDEPSRRRLLWGDARVGNMIFEDFACRAMLDWEMATVGQPEQDLGWWLFHDRHHSEGYGVARLEGLPGREETIERYAEHLGRPLAEVKFFEILAGMRLALVTARVVILRSRVEPPEPQPDPWSRNAALRVLATLLDAEG